MALIPKDKNKAENPTAILYKDCRGNQIYIIMKDDFFTK